MKLSVSDKIVSAAAIIGSLALIWLFNQDINGFTTRSNFKSMGTVVFKRLSATRRPADGLGWERMRNNGPVYDADTLRTAERSEATVFFDDGTSLDLRENSMLRLNLGGAVRNLEFLEGDISVGGGKSGSNYAISSAAGEIRVGVNSRATFSRSDDVVSVEVSEGNATLVRADGSTQDVAVNQELSINLKDGSTDLVARPIIQIAPGRNARLLFLAPQKQAEGAVRFAWKTDGGQKGPTAYTLEISQSKDFSPDVARHAVTGLETEIALSDGAWYWRVIDSSNAASPTSRFTLATAAQSRPAYPADGVEYRYRKTIPEIRFAWTAMVEASAYLFELSGDPSFDKPFKKTRVAATNLMISDLGVGTWYWRVGSIHGFTESGAQPAAEIRSVAVIKSGDMGLIKQVTPFDGLFYQIQELDGKGISFAWKPQEEAVSYELIVSRSQNLANPVMTVPAGLPYIKLVGKECLALSEPGISYWGVRWIDGEGNRSPPSKARKLNGVDGSIAIRQVFPPDGYRISDSLVGNARFSWRSNVAAKTMFVVSRNQDFSDIVFQKQVTSENILGERWSPGRYWWKIRAMNIDGLLFMETDAREFSIVEPLPGAALMDPDPGKTFFLREGDGQVFKWNKVEGADFYSVGLYSAADGYEKPLFENGFNQSTEIEYPLGNRESGLYRLRIQAFALETEMSTRIIGYIGDNAVNYRRISYLELGAPSAGGAIDGLEARRKGVMFVYKADNAPESQEFVLYRTGAYPVEIDRAMGNGNSWLRKRLDPGTYSWTIRGTLAGIDISARESAAFQVLPIPLLNPPTLLEPAEGAVYGPEELRRNRAIFFRWDPVPGANRYYLSLFSGSSAKPLLNQDLAGKTEYLMEDLSILGKGSIAWSVEARSWDSEGELEQSGIPGRSSFRIELPEVKKASVKARGPIYGR